MKPRIEKKLSKKLYKILGDSIGKVWVDSEVDHNKPFWKEPLSGAMRRANYNACVSVNNIPSIGGGFDYWGEANDHFSVLYVAKEVFLWEFGEETDGSSEWGGYPRLNIRMTGSWMIRHAKLYMSIHS